MTNHIRTDEQQAFISNEEIALINEYRTLCNNIIKRNRYPRADDPKAYDAGMISARTEAAENAAFQILNYMNACFHANISDGQFHNRPEKDEDTNGE